MPCGEVVQIEKVHENPQIIHNDTFFEWAHPTAGKVRSPRHATIFTKSALKHLSNAPLLNEHADQILSEIGLDDIERKDLKDKGIIP